MTAMIKCRYFTNKIRQLSSKCSEAKLTVWWDSSCPLCVKEIKYMKKWAKPGSVNFIDLGSTSSSCPVDRNKMLARFHAQERDGPIVHGAEAFALLWKTIPRVERFGLYLSSSPNAMKAFEWFYTKLFLPFLRPPLQRLVRRFERKTKEN